MATNDPPARVSQSHGASDASAHTPRPETESRRELDFQETVKDAVLLLDYAARHGIRLEDEIKRSIVEAEAKTKAHANLAERKRLAFWDAFTALAKALQPVTPTSIKYTRDECVNGLARRRWQVSMYTILSLAILVALVSVQLFWLGGSSLAKDVNSSLSELVTLQDQILDKEASLQQGEVTTPEIDTLYWKLREVFARLTSDHQSLNSWNRIWGQLPYMDAPFESATYETYDAATKAKIDWKSAKLFLEATHAYVLPLLYGLLGACFYVLRLMSVQIRTWTFTAQSSISYMLRLTLGPLAGLAAGLLIIEAAQPGGGNAVIAETQGLLSQLAPFGTLAAAFIAGYGVELIFTVLDRLIGAFTAREATGEV